MCWVVVCQHNLAPLYTVAVTAAVCVTISAALGFVIDSIDKAVF